MSTTIDNRVLEMRFDNAQFEKGVATSMSTLDKLKQKLNLSGASKGIETVGKAAKGVNFSGMTAGIHQVKSGMMSLEGVSAGVIAKFSVINNMVNSLMATGKRMVNALTIDPVKTGFQEYETQINAVQTILANTQKEGTNVQIVNKALDELNKYADQTIYNFTEMTRNIGTFTAAGVKLDTSVSAIKGIANLAAISGSTSQQASTAMYQLSQALAAGKVSLMDWNSVVNAGMGGQVFQDALIRTSELLKTGAKEAIATHGSFRESLTQGQWLTTEVLTETLNQFAGVYSKAELMQQGFTESQAEEISKMAKTAMEAATKVKTFTQLWDTMKEAVQSGWSQSWRLIIGDFEEAKELLTGLSDFFNKFISKSADSRNAILEGALSGNPFNKLAEKIEKVTGVTEKMTQVTKDYGDVVNKVIGGEFGNGQERFDALTKAGYDWAHVQNLVNEELGNSYRYATDYKEAQEELHKTQTRTIEDLVKMSDVQLKNLGFTKDEIEAFRDLQEQSEKTGIPIKKLIKDLDQLNGRTILINSFKNMGKGLVSVLESVGTAWKNIFWDGASDEEIIQRKTESLYNMIAALHKFSTNLTPENLPIDQIRRSFEGLFAAIDIVATIAGGGLKIGFEVLSAILGAFDMNLLDLIANIGDGVVTFRDWLFEQNIVAKAMDNFVSEIPSAISKVKEWFGSFKDIPAVESFSKAIDGIKKALSDFSLGDIDLTELANSLGTNLANALLSIPDMMVQIGKDVIAGFQNGIEEGISNSIIGDIISFCLEFISAFAEALGVQSPSWKTHDIAVDTIQGFINGLIEMLSSVINVVKYIGEQIVNAFKFIFDLVTDESGNIEWDKIFAGAMLLGGLKMLKQFVDAVDGISDAIGGIGDILEGAGDALKSFSKVLKSYSWDIKAKAIQKMAISIAILSAAVYALSTIEDPSQLWNAVGVIGALAAIVLALAGAMELMSKASLTYENGKLNIEGLKASILQIGATLLMLGLVVKIIGDMDPESAKAGFITLTGLMVEVIAFMAVVGHVVKGDAGKNIDKVGKLMTKLTVAMLLMTLVVKLASGLSADEMLQGAVFATAFAAFVIAITKVAKTAGNNVGKVGGMMVKLAIAMGLMVGVVKLIDMLDAGEMLKGAAFAAAFGIFVKALVKATTIGGRQQIAKIGGLLLSISFSLMLMVGVCKLVGMLSVSEIAKGTAFVGAFIIFVKSLVKIVTVGNEGEMVKIGGTLLALSVAVGILAGVSALLGQLDIANLAKGVLVVGLLSIFMAGMVKALKGAQNVQKSIMMLAISIGVMAGAVTALSLIDTADLAAATIALGSLMGMFAMMSKSLKGLRKVPIAPIITMIAVIGALTGIIYLLREMDANSAIGSAVALSMLMLTMAATMDIVKNAGRRATSAIGPMAGLTLILGGIAVILALLSKCEPGPTLEIATSLSEVLIAISASALILSKIGPMGTIAAKGAAALIAVVAGAGAILASLGGFVATKIDGAQKFLDDGIPILESVGKALGALFGGLIGGLGEGISGSLPEMAKDITSMMEELSKASEKASGIKGSSFEGVKRLIHTLGDIAKTTVGTSISDIFTLGGTSMEKFQTDGVAFFEAMKAISESASGTVFDENSFNSVIKAAGKLSELQSSLGNIGGVISWFKGRDDLSTFGKNIGEFMTSLKDAFGVSNGIIVNEEAFNSIISATRKLAKLQNSLENIGGVISWFKGRSDLATFGTKVSEFMTSMKTAFGVSNGIVVNEDSFDAVISSAKKLSRLQSSLEEMDGIIKWFTGDKDLSTFGTKVSEFMSSMKTAFGTSNQITVDAESFSSIISAANKLSKLQSNLEPLGGVMDWFTENKSDLGEFGANIAVFADAMGTLKAKMGETGISEDVVSSVTNAGTALSKLQTALPEEGWFDGKMNLSEFSLYIKNFATAMQDFNTKVAGISDENINAAISAAHRIKYLITTLGDLDTSGLESFTGIGTGGVGADGAMSDIAEAISDFSTKVSDIDVAAISVSVSAAMKLKSLIQSLVGLDTSGIENFKIVPIAKEVKRYSSEISGIETGNVSSSITIATRLKRFISSLSGMDSTGVSNFKPGPIGSSLASYARAVAGIDVGAVSNSIAAATKVKNFIASLSGFNSDGVSSFKSTVSTLAQTNISGLTSAFNGSTSKLSGVGTNLISSLTKGFSSGKSSLTSAATSAVTSMLSVISSRKGQFQSTAMSLMLQFVVGVRSQSPAIISAVTSSLSTAASSAMGYYGSFYNAGSYVASGLASGIRANIYAAANAAAAMAAAASQAARANLKINSPSKVFKKIGSSVPEGFALGIGMLGSTVRRSVNKMASRAVNGTQAAMTRVLDIFDGDMNSQPTISPVLDLDDVKSGMTALNGMLNDTRSIGVRYNLGSINSRMNQKSQNGFTNDVVDAINRLRKDLGNVGNVIYNIDGVTYDDGSNISDAVNSIIRAARIERRV